MAKLKLDMSKELKKYTVHVKMKFSKTVKKRLQLASLVFRFGAWVGGFGGVEISVK